MLVPLPKPGQQKLCLPVDTEGALALLFHFSCACKETQPSAIPRHCLEQPSQINAPRSWQRARGPCLCEQSREAGNQLAGIVPTAANEEPRFSFQLPLGRPRVSLRAGHPAPWLCWKRSSANLHRVTRKGIGGGRWEKREAVWGKGRRVDRRKLVLMPHHSLFMAEGFLELPLAGPVPSGVPSGAAIPSHFI